MTRVQIDVFNPAQIGTQSIAVLTLTGLFEVEYAPTPTPTAASVLLFTERSSNRQHTTQQDGSLAYLAILTKAKACPRGLGVQMMRAKESKEQQSQGSSRIACGLRCAISLVPFFFTTVGTKMQAVIMLRLSEADSLFLTAAQFCRYLVSLFMLIVLKYL